MNARPLPTVWVADLDLVFQWRRQGTVMIRNHHVGPLQVQKVLYPEGPQTCHATVLHPPGGIAAGDQLAVRATAEPGARVLLTTPGAAKWYRSDAEFASQQQRFTVMGDAVLECLPRESIVFDGSRVSTSLEVSLSAEGQFFGWEILSFGRRASGERWGQGRLRMQTRIRREAALLWSETADVDAAGGFAASAVGLSGCTVCGTFLVAGPEVGVDLMGECRRIVPARADARVGLTRVPGVWIARYLGHSTEEAFDWFTGLWAILRPALTSRAACAPRVWAC